MDVSFTSPGSYLVYCTVYCGQAHDVMQARIEVI
jgi:heme/copper-type cytochrome/quinol oxidase subunit 2